MGSLVLAVVTLGRRTGFGRLFRRVPLMDSKRAAKHSSPDLVDFNALPGEITARAESRLAGTLGVRDDSPCGAGMTVFPNSFRSDHGPEAPHGPASWVWLPGISKSVITTKRKGPDRLARSGQRASTNQRPFIGDAGGSIRSQSLPARQPRLRIANCVPGNSPHPAPSSLKSGCTLPLCRP